MGRYNDKVEIDRFILRNEPRTGIGWVGVYEWDQESKAYQFRSCFRSENSAFEFIEYLLCSDG